MRTATLALALLLLLPWAGFASSRRNACINNLKQIDRAKDAYVLEYGGTNNGAIAWANVALYIKDMSNKCICPSSPTKMTDAPSNTYRLNPIGTEPVCLVNPEDHSLDDSAFRRKQNVERGKQARKCVAVLGVTFVPAMILARLLQRKGRRKLALAVFIAGYVCAVVLCSCIWGFGRSSSYPRPPAWLFPFTWPSQFLVMRDG